jgi:predicted nucleotidyltransferase
MTLGRISFIGSKAFGLSHESSDDDFRGIFLPPATVHWSLYDLPQQLEFNDGKDDEVYWELEKFLRLALKANPNILETLWTPIVLEADTVAKKLRDIRTAFLSKHLYKTYSGYALSQFRRMRNSFQKTGKFKHKHAMHLIRLLHSGTEALRSGEIMIDVSGFRSELLDIRNGHFSFEQVEAKAKELEREFETAFEKTTLPEQPDFEKVNQFLIEARQHAANQINHES